MSIPRDRTRRYLAGSSGRERWDSELTQFGGEPLQSWNWGELKSHFGWQPFRFRVDIGDGIAMAQVLIRRIEPLGSVAYLPRGPIGAGNAKAATTELFEVIDSFCKDHRVTTLLLEPVTTESLVHLGGFNRAIRGLDSFQPQHTIQVSLQQTEDALLAQMRHDCRYSIRKAMRHVANGDIVISRGLNAENSNDFFSLLSETSERNKFGIRSSDYYEMLQELFGEESLLLTARVDSQPAAAVIAVRFGRHAFYLAGGSSTNYRRYGITSLLQFEAMRWARSRGCEIYDLWGISLEALADDVKHDKTFRRSAGMNWSGLDRFKGGFGGAKIAYPPIMVRNYVPVVAWWSQFYLLRHPTIL
jgi:peptidoglycan pentaglycine glycine transferase (the first glycine)